MYWSNQKGPLGKEYGNGYLPPFFFGEEEKQFQ